MDNRTKWQPFIYGLLIASGVMIGIWLRPSGAPRTVLFGKGGKVDEVINIIKQAYVDTVNAAQIEEIAVNGMLTHLDPHSVYIPAEELKEANEQLEGEFEGIGVEFSILNDTIIVVTPLNGGPSKELGIRSGDRIIAVDGRNVAGIGINNEQVFKMLRGEKGSKVNVTVFRPESREKTSYTITRSKIPIYSVDARMMLNDLTGYIKISRFSATTYEEFLNAVKDLQLQHMQYLILDLRGNPGGYLSAVTDMADEVLGEDKLIVYTEGRTQPRNEYHAEKQGVFEQGKLIVLIDEGSASASEIFAGAIQDQDRGIIIGRRSFGKGLVQEPFELKDGSALRLTISRYYTPSGRCIQKPYENYEAYEREIIDRYERGELEDSSKYRMQDSTIYRTAKGRIVYGGGGIMPDIFMPLDTSFQSDYLTAALSAGLLNQFAVAFTDNNRRMLAGFRNARDFSSRFRQALLPGFTDYASKKNVKGSSADLKRSGAYIELHLKALIARQLYRDEGYFTVMNADDRVLQRALRALSDYDRLLSKK